MDEWNEKVAAAAQLFRVEMDVLAGVLARHNINQQTLAPDMFEDFKAALSQEPQLGTPSAFTLRGAFGALTSDKKPEVLDTNTRTRDLVAKVNLRRPDETSRKAVGLLKQRLVRSDEPRTWSDVRFVVLATDGSIDLPTTGAVMDALEAGAADYHDGIFTSKDGSLAAVFRLEDLTLDSPRAARVYDPLHPGDFLDINKVSRKFSTVVDLEPERHQLVLFALQQNLRAHPRDAAEARMLLDLVRAAPTVEDAAKALGPTVHVKWNAAKRAQVGSASALPSIAETSRPDSGHAEGSQGNVADIFSLAVGSVPNEENLPTSLIEPKTLRALLDGEMKETLRDRARDLCGESVSNALSKADMIDLITRRNPSLKDFYREFAVYNHDGETRFDWNYLEELADFDEDKLYEIVWRIVAKSVVARAKLR